MFSLSPCTHTVISAPDNSGSLELSSVLKESFRQPKNAVQYLLPTAREGYVFTGVCLSAIGLVATPSLLILVTARSVRILLEGFLGNISNFKKVKLHDNVLLWLCHTPRLLEGYDLKRTRCNAKQIGSCEGKPKQVNEK